MNNEEEVKTIVLQEKQTAWQRFQDFLLSAAYAKRNKAREKYEATHKIMGVVQAPIINDEKFIRRGKPIPMIKPHTRQIRAANGEVASILVEVNHIRYTGWDHGKTYTGEVLRELRRRRNATA